MHNVVSLIGNLGADPEIRYTQAGDPIANLRIAVSDYFTDSSGTKQQRTYWFTCVAFRKTAEIIANYCHKGSKVGIVGRLTTRDWEAKDGTKRTSTEILINDLELLSRKENGDITTSPNRSYNKPAPPIPPPTPTPLNDEEDDEIPF